MNNQETGDVVIRVDADRLDADGFTSIWNIAASTMQGDMEKTRDLASKLLGFLCKTRYSFVVVSPSDAKYLREWFERDDSILYNWKTESDRVDVIAQHAEVPYKQLLIFLRKNKFKPTNNYSPKRSLRFEWFTEDWNVG